MTLLWMSTFRMLSPRATFARALVLTACVAACAVATANQLEAEAVVFFHRHGDRSPTALMPRDEANNKRWTEMGLGMLTPQGMAQLEALGSAFRKRYVLGEPFQVLSPSYKHGEYVVRTTDFDRTQQSALSFLQGFFPPGSGPAGGLHNKEQPVPTTVMPSELDDVLAGYSGHNCPRAHELREAAMHSSNWRKREAAHADALNRAAKAAGFASLSLRNVTTVQDALLCDRANNMTWIEPFRSEDPELYDEILSLSRSTLRPAYASSKELSRLVGGNMLAQVVSRFQVMADRLVTVPTQPTPKTPRLNDRTGTKVPIAHYSAHDSTLIALLGALGAFDDENPPYGSTVVFELLRDSTEINGERYVRAFYNKGCALDSLFAAPLASLCAGKSLCTLGEFVDSMNPMIPKDFVAECAVKDIASLPIARPAIDCMSAGFWLFLVNLGLLGLFVSMCMNRPRPLLLQTLPSAHVHKSSWV